MSPTLAAAYRSELTAARTAERAREHARAFHHLERAHVLSQRYGGAHVHVHLLMLGFALRRRDRREVLGQIVRVLVAAPGSWLGRAPRGNTGGADVGIMTPMPIPADLARLLDA